MVYFDLAKMISNLSFFLSSSCCIFPQFLNTSFISSSFQSLIFLVVFFVVVFFWDVFESLDLNWVVHDCVNKLSFRKQ